MDHKLEDRTPPLARVKGVGRQQQGVHKRLPDCHPIRFVNHSRCMKLNLNHGWMHALKKTKCNSSR